MYILYIIYTSFFSLRPVFLSHTPNCNCNNCNTVTLVNAPSACLSVFCPRNPLIPNIKIIFLKSLQKNSPLSPPVFWPRRTFALPLLRRGQDNAKH